MTHSCVGTRILIGKGWWEGISVRIKIKLICSLSPIRQSPSSHNHRISQRRHSTHTRGISMPLKIDHGFHNERPIIRPTRSKHTNHRSYVQHRCEVTITITARKKTRTSYESPVSLLAVDKTCGTNKMMLLLLSSNSSEEQRLFRHGVQKISWVHAR